MSGSLSWSLVRPSHLALVFAGGTLGTAARAALGFAFPPVARIPVAVLGVNVVGAFVLGFLLETLTRRGPDRGARRGLRLLLGSGFLGGFTTYSALSADTALLAGAGQPGTAIAYAVGSVLLGVLAAGAGVLLASRGAVVEPEDTP